MSQRSLIKISIECNNFVMKEKQKLRKNYNRNNANNLDLVVIC